MAGETDLQRLLATLAPILREPRYVFCTVPGAVYGDYAEARPLASFLEAEGLTLVLEQDQAEQQQLAYHGIFRCISLSVHSSLEAVGLTAAIATALSAHGISANVIAAHYHDHVFVAERDADKALAVLLALATQSKQV